MINKYNNNPKYNKHVFVRDIFVTALFLLGIFPIHFILDKQLIGINCITWLILVIIFAASFLCIFWQRKW